MYNQSKSSELSESPEGTNTYKKIYKEQLNKLKPHIPFNSL